MIIPFLLGNFIVISGVGIMVPILNYVHEIRASTMRYLIMMDFEPFSSPKVVHKWTYPTMSVVFPKKSMSYFGKSSIWPFGMPTV